MHPGRHPLFAEGEPVKHLGIIVRGEVNIQYLLGNGEMRTVDTLVGGDLLGFSAPDRAVQIHRLRHDHPGDRLGPDRRCRSSATSANRNPATRLPANPAGGEAAGPSPGRRPRAIGRGLKFAAAFCCIIISCTNCPSRKPDRTSRRGTRPGRTERGREAAGTGRGKAFRGALRCLRFAFELLSPGTPAEGAELLIREPPAISRCRQCAASTEIAEMVIDCPQCGSPEIVIEEGRELLLESIESRISCRYQSSKNTDGRDRH